jgi:hypothetical protein
MQNNDAKFLQLATLAKNIYLNMKKLKELERNQSGGGVKGDNYKNICKLTAIIAADLKKQAKLDDSVRKQ